MFMILLKIFIGLLIAAGLVGFICYLLFVKMNDFDIDLDFDFDLHLDDKNLSDVNNNKK